MKPKNTNCSQNQVRTNIRIILGKAKPNQVAKLTISPFSGKSLWNCQHVTIVEEKRSTIVICVSVRPVLIHLSHQDDVGCGSCESGRASDAGSVTHAQTHAFGQLQIPLLPLEPPVLCRRTPVEFLHGRDNVVICGDGQRRESELLTLSVKVCQSHRTERDNFLI